MADVEQKAPVRRRVRRSGETSSSDDRQSDSGAERRPPPDADTPDEEEDRAPSTTADEQDDRHGTDADDAPRVTPGSIARHAAHLVASLSGRRPESVISIERKDAEWHVGVEVVEVSRIPDSADILAVYDVRLDRAGDLLSYRRIRRYARGQMDCERQR
jgi:hypothetical protein